MQYEMPALSEERQQQLKRWLEPQITELESYCDEIPFGLDYEDQSQLDVMKIALAVLTKEPEAPCLSASSS